MPQGHHKGSLSKMLACGPNETFPSVFEPVLVCSSPGDTKKETCAALQGLTELQQGQLGETT